MSTDRLRELVEDTLYQRRMHSNGTCFTYSIAAFELRRESSQALPAVERIVIDVVAPVFDSTDADERALKHRALLAPFIPARFASHIGDDAARGFRGLKDLFGAYLQIGCRTDPMRVFAFVDTLSDRLRSKAIGAAAVYFGTQNSPNSIRIPPTKDLFDFLERSTESESELVHTAAISVLQHLKRQPA